MEVNHEGRVLGVAACLVMSLGASRAVIAQPATQGKHESQTAEVAVTEKGFEPSTIALKPNVLARVTFVRETAKTCAKALSIPEYKIRRELPLNKPVVVEFTPDKSGEFTFACGMDMLKGTVGVKEQ